MGYRVSYVTMIRFIISRPLVLNWISRELEYAILLLKRVVQHLPYLLLHGLVY